MGVMECTLSEHLSDAQADLAAQLAERAARCWWQPGHPGFAVAPLDSERFLSSLAGSPSPFAVPLNSPLLATGERVALSAPQVNRAAGMMLLFMFGWRRASEAAFSRHKQLLHVL